MMVLFEYYTHPMMQCTIDTRKRRISFQELQAYGRVLLDIKRWCYRPFRHVFKICTSVNILCISEPLAEARK